MEPNQKTSEPDNTAVRTALWRALHLQLDAKPHILEDEIGLKLVAPTDDWQQRPDMKFTKRLRASIIGRSRFIEDLVLEQNQRGISQYVILGSGLDTFAQRRTESFSQLQIFEIDQPDTLAWKQKRLIKIGLAIPEYLHFVPVNFEICSWWKELLKSGFNISKPAIISCTGVSLYLTKDAINTTLHEILQFVPGSKLAMTFYLPIELLDEEDKSVQKIAEEGARKAGTPFVSFFTPDEILELANEAGFNEAKIISTKDMDYFTNRTDSLLPASGELFLLATT
jgi:methyltransferase (TIGR00027 family)